MKKIFLPILLLTLHFIPAFSQVEDTEEQQLIADFISCVKQDNKAALAGKVAFPLNRQYPLPPIKNKQEFQTRYHEVFNDTLVRLIVNSEPARDWTQMRWRGIMLGNGVLWLDHSGQLKAVNYQSPAERKKRQRLIAKDKQQLHPSLRNFERPACLLETSKFMIRIDDMGDGNYRYASWPAQGKQSDKPDLIITDGQCVFEGSGGNHRYEFKNKDYRYSCNFTVLGLKDPPPHLTVYKGDKAILSQATQTAKW